MIPNDKVYLVATSDGGSLKDRSRYKGVYDIVKSSHNEDLVVDLLVKDLLDSRS